MIMDIKALPLTPAIRTVSSTPASGGATAATESQSALATKTTVVDGRTAAGRAADSGLARFVSPVIQVDPTAKLTFLAFRDGVTGEVTNSIPAKQVLDRYRRNGGRHDDDSGQSRNEDGKRAGGVEAADGRQADGAKSAAARVAAAYGRQTGSAATGTGGASPGSGSGSGSGVGGTEPSDTGVGTAKTTGSGGFGVAAATGTSAGSSTTGGGASGGGSRVSLTV
ncbi:conserved hypothetical protein [uncultured Gammaproteobacteria bacterium]